MSVDTDISASLPTLEAPYQGFRDPSASHVSIWTSFLSNRVVSITEHWEEGAWMLESLQWNLLPGLVLDLPLLSVGSLLILRCKRTPVPAAASHSYWNFMSCPRSSFVRRPNLHRPLRLIANLWKSADVAGTEEGFSTLVSLAMHSLMCFICRA